MTTAPLIVPFEGIRYAASDLTPRLCPPYDIISPQEREELYRRHPQNAIRLEFPLPAENRSPYQAAAQTWQQWLQEGVLQQEEAALYVLRSEFVMQGEKRARLGLFAALHLESLQNGRVLPHEGTLAAAKADRLALLNATEANFSPVWTIYRNPALPELLTRATSGAPVSQAEEKDGCGHSLWRISDKTALEEIGRSLGDGPLFIADGHHRYETALAFSQQHPAADPAAPINYVLSLLVEAEDPGLIILPTHRVISGLSKEQSEKMWTYLRENCEPEKAEGLEDLLRKVNGYHFGLYTKGEGFWLFTVGRGPNPTTAPVALLHAEILTPIFDSEMPISYHMDAQEATAAADAEEGAAFFLRPLRSEELIRAALARERLPGKSTYFWPKIPSGVVMRSLK